MARYDESSIRSLDWKEHIRLRPGMYIGKLGDGSAADDGVYMLLKEIIDNSIDECVMGHGSRIEIALEDGKVGVRDFGRGIPLSKLVDCVAKINTGAKYDSEAFKKSVGLNGVGTKAVNALSEKFLIRSVRDHESREALFERGDLVREDKKNRSATGTADGTFVEFVPDQKIFGDFRFRRTHIDQMLWNYAYLNRGLTLSCNGDLFLSKNGLSDLMADRLGDEPLRYPVIHFVGKDCEVALTHTSRSGEEYFSFVNGQHTTMGGTHLNALRECLIKTIRAVFNKEFDPQDIRSGLVAAVSIRIEEPVFESQTKTKLGSQNIGPSGPSIRSWVGDYVGKELDNYLHRHKPVAQAMLDRIAEAEKERKELAGIRKLAKDRTRKANVFNKKLRDCRIHFDGTHKRKFESTVFITEGDSASGSITKSRDVETQAVFSLRGKPLNTFGMNKKIVYQNEELNLLQHALNIEENLSELRYNQVVIATDADVDGMHIRLLLLTFFLQYFPDLVREGHVHILQTPLFRVRNKQKTLYCYDEKEKISALNQLGKNAETTRFKGLGEISPSEFEMFIRPGKMRLEPVRFQNSESEVFHTLRFYMGKNTPDKQDFIVKNLRSILV